MWRSVHALGYAAWAIALAHGFTTGTDTSVGWVRVTYLLCAAAGLGALAWRYAAESRPQPLLRHVTGEAVR